MSPRSSCAVCLTALLVLQLGATRAAAAAGGAASVWIAPVLDAASNQPDAELTRALGVAVALHGPRDNPWRLGDPLRGRCPSSDGCEVIRIEGSRTDRASYTLRRAAAPGGRTLETRLSAPRGTSLFQVAEALVVKCSYLLQIVRPQPTHGPTGAAPPTTTRVAQQQPAEEPPDLVRAPARRLVRAERPLVHSLGVGPSLMAGLDRPFFTVGVELGGTFSLHGPLALRTSIAFQDLGQGVSPSGEAHEYTALPLTLMVGGWWEWSRIGLGAFGGLAMTALWLQLESDTLPETSEVAVGLAVEGRASVRLHRRLTLGLALRGTVIPDDVEVAVDDHLLFNLPHLLLGATADLQVSF